MFIWTSVNRLGLTYEGKVGISQVKSKLDQGKVVILSVNGGGHWVLATGYSGNTIYVNDPGFARTSYQLSEITQAAIFDP